jgi:hypothetical protein
MLGGSRSTGSSRAQAARPRSSSDSTQPIANIGQISWPRYIVKAVSWPTVICCCQTNQPPTPMRQHGGGTQRQADCRLVGGLPLQRLVVAVRRRPRALRELDAGARLQPERAQGAHAGHGLLHVVVQAREAVERLAPGIVHAARDRPEAPRHERKRQQRHQGEAPVDAERHHRDHQHQRQGAVEAGQEGSPAASSTASTSLVARAIRSPVRLRLKNCGPCVVSLSYSRVRSSTPRR